LIDRKLLSRVGAHEGRKSGSETGRKGVAFSWSIRAVSAFTFAVEARFEAAALDGFTVALAGFAAALAAGFFAAPLFLIRLANISAMLPRVEVFPAVVFAFFICFFVVFVDFVSFLLGLMIIVIFEVRPSP
jgi:hypothetical protein